MNKKIFLDCTHTYNSGLNTGIQRVVKNIVKNAQAVSKDLDVEIIPIVLINKIYYTFDKFPDLNKEKHNKIKIKNYLKGFYKLLKKGLSFIFLDKISDFLNSPKVTIFLNEITDKFLFSANNKINKEVVFLENDILILLDSIWYNNHNVIIGLKKRNIKIVNIIYDFIPLLYPQFCDEHLTEAFSLWYKKSNPFVDKYICISKSVEDECFLYIKEKFDTNISKNKFDYFYLGANIKDSDFNAKEIENSYKKLFETKNVFITVSTIEPRKNYKYILDAFEKLWEKNVDVKYIIIGRIGWKVEDFIQRVQNHKEFNKRLFMLNNIDDEHLLYAYKNSKALIFASFREGFGLPIIESLYNKLQVLVSNIEIHREIGKDKVSYFDLDDTDSLVELIEKDDFNKNIDDFKWISWEESTKQLINKVLEDK